MQILTGSTHPWARDDAEPVSGRTWANSSLKASDALRYNMDSIIYVHKEISGRAIW